MRYIPPALGDHISPASARLLAEDDIPLEANFQELFDFEEGKHQVYLALGGIVLQVTTDDAELMAFLEREYGSFITADSPRATLAIRRSESFPIATLTGKTMLYREERMLAAKFRGMAAYFDPVKFEAKGWMVGGNFRQDLSNIIRFVVGAVMPQFDAFLFHTAAIASRERAYLFFGPATAGKSTLMRLSRTSGGDRTVMTDDMLIVRLEGGKVRAATCGFWGGETRDMASERHDYPVAGFFRLHKAFDNALVPMQRSRAAMEIACNIPAIKRGRDEHEQVLDLATQMAALAPAFELHFHKRDATFWRLLDELDG